MPFGGKLVKSVAGMSLNFAEKYLDNIGALPFVFQSCRNCDTVINTELFTNISSAFSPGSSN